MAVMTMATLDSPHERLAWARQKAGFADKADFARATGVNPTTYRAYENGQNGFAKHAAAFARKLGVTAEWLLDGGPAPDVVEQPLTATDIAASSITASAIRVADETVHIQKLDLSLSMGPGTLIDDWVEAQPVSFDLAFIRGITRSPPDRLKLVTGIGDSMYPTLNWGDVILIDTTDRQLARQDGVYWIDLFGASGIKRLRTVGQGRVLVISDNRDVPDQEVDAADLRIQGRAIWLARGI